MMRITVVVAAALVAVSVSCPRCHADFPALPGSDSSTPSPGLATDLPGSDLGGLQVQPTRPSRQAATEPMESGALFPVLKDPSSASAAPGALMSSAPGDHSQDWIRSPSGLLSSRDSGLARPGANPAISTNAPGAGRITENGGLFISQVTPANTNLTGASGSGQPAAMGTDEPAAPRSPMLLPGAFMGLAAPQPKPAAKPNQFYSYALACLCLAVAPLAAGLLRRRLA